MENKERSKKLIAGIFITSVVMFLSLPVIRLFYILFSKGTVDRAILQNAVFISVIVLLLGLAALVTLIYNYRVGEKKQTRSGVFSTKNITRLAIMTAFSYVLYMFVKFPLPFFPDFLDMQISDVPALICGFMMGPVSGCLVIFFKVLLKLPFSSTVCVGELGDLLIGIAFVLPASLIYKFNKSKKGALIGLGVGVLTSTAVAVLINWLILIPWFVYSKFGNNWDIIIGALSLLYPDLTVSNFYFWYLLCAIIPFNLMRGLVSALVTFLVYKSLGKIFNKMVPKREN